MHIRRTLLLTLLLAGITILTSGCLGIVPGSRQYQPLPKWEAKFAAEARYDVFPNDVRQDPNSFTNTLVVWTGIITKIEPVTNSSPQLIQFTADHHYFDWIEDFGPQRSHFFLSPRGEGAFAVRWIAESPNDQKFIAQFAVGDMLVAYGYPTVIRTNYIGLNPTMNLRAFKPGWFSTEIFDYGRPGSPVKVLKHPIFGD